jgi:hypothetical protein
MVRLKEYYNRLCNQDSEKKDSQYCRPLYECIMGLYHDGKGPTYGYNLFRILVIRNKVEKCGLIFFSQMLIDGIGLGIITVCTTWEGIDDWEAPLSDYYPTNVPSIFFWISGLTLAIGGLVFLIINAAALESLHEWEHLGMAMLTFAPVINMLGWFLLETRDPFHVYNKQLYATEVLEFIGMSTLCFTYHCGHRYTLEWVLEMVGYIILACAAMLDVTYLPEKFVMPIIAVRTHNYHKMDVFGLFLLAVCGTGKYHIHRMGGDTPPPAPSIGLKSTWTNGSLIKPKFATP